VFICSGQRSVDSSVEPADWATAQDRAFALPTASQPLSYRLYLGIVWPPCIAWTDYRNKERTSLLFTINQLLPLMNERCIQCTLKPLM